MQHKFSKLLIFCGTLNLASLVHAFPSCNEIIEKIKAHGLFDESQLGEMCRIEESEYGYSAWAAAFPTLLNSDLPQEKQLEVYVCLTALAINQTNDKDSLLNSTISQRLEQIEGLKSEVDPSITDLQSEFKSRSNPSSPVGSPCGFEDSSED